MNRKILSALLNLCWVLMLMLTNVGAETLTGQVIVVTDGDTVKVKTEKQVVRVRLAGIDTPERKQPYGAVATAQLTAWVLHQWVMIDSAGTDRYGRHIGMLKRDGVNINAALVATGAAWVYRAYPYPPVFLDLEATARAAETGLWGQPERYRCPPWDWRRGRCASQQKEKTP